MADIPIVKAIEHRGPATGMNPNRSAVTLWITLKIHTSYLYGVPDRTSTQRCSFTRSKKGRLTADITPEIVPDHVGKINGLR